ncbi:MULTISPECIES: NAD(P)H-dependent oxidoreductase [Mesonia]|uniref:General stress protein 14 n=1 Tax=Mesonia oceanica TaxID=2687242 RepID=A0AC61YCM3_9FLAO|nr:MULTISPECIES: NAD(P)H-dependent oxidoreductase [Mesonia]MAN29406.1 general stress protein [Mesonia sp.]MAS72879.1 general stress protein [Zunongwangia sp.]VVV02231.1 General stress protein 14 [Mesonia oceanica]|tara:strand:- start:7515 stop:8060 length:546 start_codon:yes stop_codon:yes gene_type:complete
MALIILGHPNYKNSFANKTVIEELKKSDLDLEIRDLQKLYPDYNIHIQAEQEALLRHQTIVFQYPFYWYNMPAILKHWFDEVFAYQFAYGSEGDKLKGKNFVPSFTVGSSESSYSVLGSQHFRVYEFCKNLEQTALFAHMNYVDPIYFHGTSLAAGYTETDIKNNAKQHATKLIKHLAELG